MSMVPRHSPSLLAFLMTGTPASALEVPRNDKTSKLAAQRRAYITFPACVVQATP